MKHEPIKTEADALLDLSKPSLEALAFMLRHREMWPGGFEWNYNECSTCAVGMARRLWESSIPTRYCISEDVAKAFGMRECDASLIFIRAARRRYILATSVTPEMVADDIDAYLAERGRGK